MKYQNNTSEGIVIPVKNPQVGDEIADIGWIKFQPSEIKDVPEQAYETAEKHGLTKVESIKEEVAPIQVKTEEVKVIAEESKIGTTKVETKKVKKRK